MSVKMLSRILEDGNKGYIGGDMSQINTIVLNCYQNFWYLQN